MGSGGHPEKTYSVADYLSGQKMLEPDQELTLARSRHTSMTELILS